MSIKIGLKIWSHNDYYTEICRELFSEGYFDYMELYVVKGSFDRYISVWKDLDIPYIIHAPHSSHGLNLASIEKKHSNLILFDESARYADELDAPYIIMHPGILGCHDSVKEQLLSFNDQRIIVENKPYIALNGEDICAGASPGEIREYISSAGSGFCFDINHAVNYAVHNNKDHKEVIRDFCDIGPAVIHLSGMEKNSRVDKHLHLYEGDLDLGRVVDILSDSTAKYWTIEAPKDSRENLDDFKVDVATLKEMI